MKPSGLLGTAALLLLPLAHGWSQGATNFEVALLGGARSLDPGDDRPAGALGARVGVSLRPELSIEAAGAYLRADSADGSVAYVPLHLQAVYAFGLGERSALLLGAGPSLHLFGSGEGDTRIGAGTLAGVRHDLTERGAVRLHLTADFVDDRPGLPAVDEVVVGVEAGLSYTFGPRRALPRGGVVLLAAPPEPALSRITAPIPAAWDGRLLRVGASPPSLGGEATHDHTMAHVHRLDSGPPRETERPLGILRTVARGTHVHAVASQSQSPLQTGPAPHLPPSRELLARTVARTVPVVRPGVIVAFTGDSVPPGWLPADGTRGTPDLRELYVVVRRDAVEPGVVGREAHDHSTAHTHTWASATPDTLSGLSYTVMNDRAPFPDPDLAAAPLHHRHPVREAAPWGGRSTAAAARPPTVRVRFIQAGPGARGMPAGALLPFAGDQVPLGWTAWTRHGENPALDRFLIGTADPAAVGTLFGSEIHTHGAPHAHGLLLLPEPDARIEGRRHVAPAVALAGHGHPATAELAPETGPATHVPPYVSLRFIRKN